MKRRRYKPRRLHAVSDIGVNAASRTQIQADSAGVDYVPPVTNDTTFSLKVYTEAYLVAMEELT